MARQKPNIDVGSITTKRDRQYFKDFVLDVIKDTFIFEFDPTNVTLDVATQTLFTLYLGPVDADGDGFYTGVNDKVGFRFVYEDLIVDNAIDYIDVYLYGVKQSKDKYIVELYNESGTKLSTDQNASGTYEIRIVFSENITRLPLDVLSEFNDSNVSSPFVIKGKITEIE